MSSNSRRAGAYRVRERDISVHPRTAYASNRPPSSVYSSGSHILQYPKSVITLEFYDPPAASMTDQNTAQHHVLQSPQRRPVRVGRSNSPKAVTRHQVGVKKMGGGVGGGKALSQRTTSSPAISHYRTGTGFFTITAYLPSDGGKRLKVRNRERERMSCSDDSCRREEEGWVYTQIYIYPRVYALKSLQERTHVYICTQLFGKSNS